eukprot:TRINITY_DN1971_c0_g1_i2.p1 TRINITY_DN1971_c0_g1~~TRINITY_DN1971_c0_g1_i2.p1  ORF type:complete len:408 (+),score=75.84 TRINITY_DN1971_c0_g1_i2:291-1514(+)
MNLDYGMKLRDIRVTYYKNSLRSMRQIRQCLFVLIHMLIIHVLKERCRNLHGSKNEYHVQASKNHQNDQIQDLENRVRALRSENEELTDKVKSLTWTNESQKRDYLSRVSNLEYYYTDEINRFKLEISDLKKLKEETNNLQNENNFLRKQISNLQNQYNDLQKYSNRRGDDFGDSRKILDVLKSELEKYKDIESKYQRNLAELEIAKHQSTNVLSLKEEIRRLKKSLQRAESFSQKYNELLVECETLKNNQIKWEGLCKFFPQESLQTPIALAHTISELQRSVQFLTLQNGELSSKIKVQTEELSSFSQKVFQLEKDLQKSQQTVASLHEDVSKKQLKMMDLNKENGLLKRKIEEKGDPTNSPPYQQDQQDTLFEENQRLLLLIQSLSQELSKVYSSMSRQTFNSCQ